MTTKTHKCSCGECGGSYPLHLHSKCHTGEPTQAVLLDESTVQVQCSVCEQEIVSFQFTKMGMLTKKKVTFS